MSSEERFARPLTRLDRYVVLMTALLGWMFAGSIMAIIPLAGRPAAIALGVTDEGEVGRWFAWYICAFLLGAALGGLVFGWLGDRIGRAKSMGLSILTYSLLTGATYWVASPEQLLVLRFLACMGVGGMWPNGVALVSEVWSDVSRPFLSGLIGTAANIGFVLLGGLASWYEITPQAWRWILVVSSSPAVLGVFALFAVRESPRWLAHGIAPAVDQKPQSPAAEVFRPPLLSLTLLGICLGMIPLLGNWGGANWVVPWADQVAGDEDPLLKGRAQAVRSTGAALGSLIGGWLAMQLGRRVTYFGISLASLATSVYLFYFITPLSPQFLFWVFAVGFAGTIYFGWLPLYLPELFPTRVRATGTGVTFNFGRIISALGVVGAGEIILYFHGDYARVGQVTCLIYVLGLIVICFAPDTSRRQLSD